MWKPVNTEYYIPQIPVSVVSLYEKDNHLRSMIESLGGVVLLHRPRTVSDFLKVISQGENAPRYMIISVHGMPDGFWFGHFFEIDKETRFDKSLLHNDCLPSEVIRQHANLPGCTVISHSCYGGSKPMAEAFLAGGVAAYIGCQVAYGNVFFLMHVLYGILVRKLTDYEAWHQAVAASHDEVVHQMSYFHSDGTKEIFEA